MSRKILWWGRFDPDYSRNRILRSLFTKLGFEITNFKPMISFFGFFEASIRLNIQPDFVFVPCFRHRDINSAVIWSKKNGIPLIIDPLISKWDKQINERKKFSANNYIARKIKEDEAKLFNSANLVLADTKMHAQFFERELGVPKSKIPIVYVGAEEKIFKYKKLGSNNLKKIKVLFYGSFINLHGAKTIIQAARILSNKNIEWTLIGDGPHLNECKVLASNFKKIKFFPKITYKKLPKVIHSAHILLGVFGSSKKASNVIPNKVFQSLASGRLVITQKSKAYPKEIKNKNGIFFVKCNNPEELAKEIIQLAENKQKIIKNANNARKIYLNYFSEEIILLQLKKALKKININ